MQNSSSSQNGNITSGKHLSCWLDPKWHPTPFESLKENLETEIVIVGAGLAGLTTAYCLASSGHKVIVVEDGEIGSGETGRTTAQIVTALDNRYFQMEKVFGKQNTALIAESHMKAIDFIEEIVRKENIDCDFKRINGYLFLHPSDKKEHLRKEYKALLRCKINASMSSKTPGIPAENSCIVFPDQAQFHPIKYVNGLCKAIESRGGKIFTNTHAAKIDKNGIETKTGFTIKAKHIVVATNAPVNDTYTMMLKQTAYRSYVIGALIKKNTIPAALWWDTGDQNLSNGTPYHYVRLDSYDDQYDLLIAGGEDHPVGVESGLPAEERYSRLEKWTRDRFTIENIVYKWSGEVLVPMDSIAYLGRNRFDYDNVYIITGDAGIGMTYCTIGGMLISDLINGVKNKWEDIYKPSRTTLKTSKIILKILKDDLIAVLKKWFYRTSQRIDTMRSGEGTIVIINGKKYGAYLNSFRQLYLVDAECTHLKCMVAWNKDEKSWDCPCHGSRFTYTGEVINGPANTNLKLFKENEYPLLKTNGH